jgi:hypothetical protein
MRLLLYLATCNCVECVEKTIKSKSMVGLLVPQLDLG